MRPARAWVRRVGLGLILATLVPGCTRPPETRRSLDSRIFADRQAVALDYTTPSYRFDGLGGSLLPTRGWNPPEVGKRPKDTPFFAWAMDREAAMVFLRPPGSGYDLFARAKPIHWPGASIQELAVFVNGHRIAVVHLAPGWNTYRLAIPDRVFVDGLNTLQMNFSISQRPMDIRDTDDDRNLSCAFSDIALVPAAAEDPWALLDIPRFDTAQGLVEVPVHGGISIPLPGNVEGTLKLGSVASTCGSCRLVVEDTGPTGLRVLWRGAVETASDLEIPFRTSQTWVSFLGIRVEPPEDGPVAATTKALIEIPPDSLEVAVSPRDAAGRPPPPVFVYMIDTLRADALEPYGSRLPTSPRIAGFAERAVTYLDAWAPSSWTLPSVASLFTGVFPSRHNMGLAEHKLQDSELKTLARLLAEAGYRTLGISHSHVASAAFGLDSGFDSFYLSNHLNSWQLRSQEIRRFLLMLMATARLDQPLFSYLHSVDPHGPYAPGDEDRLFARDTDGRLPDKKYRPMPFILEGLQGNPREVEHLQALYLGEVRFADRQFGLFLDLLEQLSLLDDSMIVLLSDHGEEFAEHGSFDHGRTVYEEMLRVPLMIQFPQARWSGRRIERRVSLLDVLPTVLAEAGISDPPSIQLDGRGLDPDRLAGEAARPVIAETHARASEHRGPVDLQALAIDTIKCIHSSNGLDQFANPYPEWQAFDLEQDPEESRSLAPDDGGYERCQSVLANWLEARAQWEGAFDAEATEVDEKDLETLRALGYIQ